MGKDVIGKTLARVIVNGYDVSEELVKAGYAWHFTKYTTNARLDSLQDYSISQGIGLWKKDSPMAPWVFREKMASAATTHSVKKMQVVSNTVSLNSLIEFNFKRCHFKNLTI